MERKKIREAEELTALTNRLRRIEGQVAGIRGMVERHAYCVDILNQTAAAISALAAFEKELLTRHIESCVVSDIRAGKEDAAAELSALVARLLK